MLDRLEQITMEESYSRVNMRKILKADIEQKCSKLKIIFLKQNLILNLLRRTFLNQVRICIKLNVVNGLIVNNFRR